MFVFFFFVLVPNVINMRCLFGVCKSDSDEGILKTNIFSWASALHSVLILRLLLMYGEGDVYWTWNDPGYPLSLCVIKFKSWSCGLDDLHSEAYKLRFSVTYHLFRHKNASRRRLRRKVLGAIRWPSLSEKFGREGSIL